MSRRGIPLSSGVYETSLAKAIEPQSQAAALSRNQSIQSIDDLIGSFAGQEAQGYMNLDQAIAAIQAATGTDAITAAQSLYNAQMQAQQQAAAQALQQQQLDWQQKTYNQEWPYQQQLLEQQIAKGNQGNIEPTPFPTFNSGIRNSNTNPNINYSGWGPYGFNYTT